MSAAASDQSVALVPSSAAEGSEERSSRVSQPRPTALTRHGVRQFIETDHGIRFFLQNCVATLNLGTNPDLTHIATHARNAEYNPKRFAAAVIRMRDPKATALIFRTGKVEQVVVTGAKNEDDSRYAARKVTRLMQKLGFPARFRDFKIQNLVGSGDCAFPIRLEGLADEHGRFSNYEPELFAGLIYRMQNPKVVMLIFVTGKVVITGPKSRTDMKQAFEKIYPVLLKYRKAPAAV